MTYFPVMVIHEEAFASRGRSKLMITVDASFTKGFHQDKTESLVVLCICINILWFSGLFLLISYWVLFWLVGDMVISPRCAQVCPQVATRGGHWDCWSMSQQHSHSFRTQFTSCCLWETPTSSFTVGFLYRGVWLYDRGLASFSWPILVFLLCLYINSNISTCGLKLRQTTDEKILQY